MYIYNICIYCIRTEMETVTATSIANEKTSVVRASGWKISRLDPQIEDMVLTHTHTHTHTHVNMYSETSLNRTPFGRLKYPE